MPGPRQPQKPNTFPEGGAAVEAWRSQVRAHIAHLIDLKPEAERTAREKAFLQEYDS